MKGTLSLRGFRKLRTGAIVATGVFLIGLASVQTTVQASEEDGVWVARTVEQVKADIQKEDNFFKYEIKWGDTLSVISEATNIPVDVLKEMNRVSDRNLFLPHNELLYTEGESVTDSKTKHKIVIKESYGKKEVRTYEVVLQKNQETTEVTFELKETTEKVQESNRSVVSYDEVYNLVSEVAPAQPAEDQPAAPGTTETPTPAQPTEETPVAPGGTETPAPAQPTEEQPTAPGATETPVPTKPVEEQPTAPGTTEKPATAQPTEEQPATPGATEIPAPAQPEVPSNKVEGTEEPENKAETAPADPETTVEGATSGQPSEESGTTASATQPNSTEDTAGDSNTSNNPVVVEKEEPGKADSSSKPAEGTSETTGTAADSINNAEGTAPTQPEGGTSVTPEVNDGATGGEEETQGNPEAPSNKVEGTEETGNKAETAPADPETTVEGATSGQPSEESGTTANATQPNSTEDTAGDSNTSNDSVVVEKEESEKADSSSTPAEGTSETTGTAADSTNKAEGTAGATTPTQPEGENSVDKEDSVKKAKDDSIKENIMTVYNRKLEIINKLSDENEKNKLKMGLEALKNEAVAAITEANDENKVISVTEHYQTAIDGFEVPGEEFNGPDFSKEGLSNGRNDGTTIDENSSGNIGHASSSPTSNTSNEASNNRENTGFRNAPVYQPRVTRRARSVDEPMDKVAIYYNYTEMKDIAGFLGDPGESVVTVPKGATHEQVQAIVKSKIDEKKAELAKKGYTFLEDYFVDKPQEDTIRYDYIVNFTKPSSLRMAPMIQPRASRTRRSVEEPKVKTRTITLYYQLAELEIAGSLGNPGQNYVITVPETATAEEIQQAIDQQTSREKASLSRYFQYVGETNLQNDILDRGFGNFDYVITFARRK